MEECLAQQTSILAVAAEALGQLAPLDPERTGVYVGMCVDPQAARHGLRGRLPELLATDADPDRWRKHLDQLRKRAGAPERNEW